MYNIIMYNFTINVLQLQHVSIFFGSSSGSAQNYMCKT